MSVLCLVFHFSRDIVQEVEVLVQLGGEFLGELWVCVWSVWVGGWVGGERGGEDIHQNQ